MESPHPVTALKIIREQVFYESQEQFARRIGVAAGTLSTWENGHRAPSMRSLAGIATILGYTMEQLYQIAGIERPRLPTPARRPYEPPVVSARPRVTEADLFDSMVANVETSMREQNIDPAAIEHIITSIRNAQYGFDPMRRHIVVNNIVDAGPSQSAPLDTLAKQDGTKGTGGK